MIVVESISVRPVRVDKVAVSWKFEQTLENFHDYSFSLQRSQTKDSGFEQIYSFVDAIEYLDEVNIKRLWNTIFYRIEVLHIASGTRTYSHAVTFGTSPNLEALEIIRRNDILLKNKRHGIGVPLIAYIRKRSGIECTCWDKDKKRVRTSSCEDCFGSGFESGYYPPVITWANVTPDNKLVQIPQWGEVEPNEVRIFVSNYPLLIPKDVLINPFKMELWVVENVQTTERRGCTLHQVVSASYIDRNSILYRLLDRDPAILDLAYVESGRIRNE